MATSTLNTPDTARRPRTPGRFALIAGVVVLAATIHAESAPSPDVDPELATQNEVIGNLYAEGRYAEGIELVRNHLAEWVAKRGADSPEACSMASNLGPLLDMAGEIEAAGEAHREAIDCLRRTFGPESEDLASALNNYGSHLDAIADFGRAEVALRESIRLLRLNLGEDHVYVAITLNNLGMNQQNQGNPVAAERTMRDAVARLRTSLGPDHSVTATALNNLGRLLAMQGELEAAAPLLTEALAVRDSVLGPDNQQTAIGRRDLGRLRYRQDRFAEAENLLREALAAFIATGGANHPDVAMTRHDLGRVLAARGRPDEARAEFTTALDLDTAEFGEGHASLVQISRELGELDMAAGRPDLALARFLAAGRAFEAGRDLTGEGLSRATYLDSPWRDVAAARLRVGDESGAWDALQSSLGRVLADVLFPDKTPPLDSGADTAVIGWLDVDAGDGLLSWAWSLRGDDIRWHPLPEPDTHAGAVAALRDALSAPGPLGHLRDLAHTLWRLRVAPLAADLDGAAHVVVVPSGSMLGLPLGALVDDEDRWLADRWSVSYAPSPRVHAWLHQHARRKEGPALFVGHPELRGDDIATAGSRRPSDAVIRGVTHGLREDLDRLPPLPGTRVEVQSLATGWPGSTVLLGPDASESAIVELAAADGLRRFRVLHFATHALVDAADADASALVLSQTGLPDPLTALAAGDRLLDGLVTSGEITDGWRLDADLVVLSACNSALGRAVAGEGLVGFAHAFLRTGARAVLVSQWSVPDKAAQVFMDAFYRSWHGAGMGRAAALRRAREDLREYRDDDRRRPYRHPYYWASFVLVGDER